MSRQRPTHRDSRQVRASGSDSRGRGFRNLGPREGPSFSRKKSFSPRRVGRKQQSLGPYELDCWAIQSLVRIPQAVCTTNKNHRAQAWLRSLSLTNIELQLRKRIWILQIRIRPHNNCVHGIENPSSRSARSAACAVISAALLRADFS